MKSKSVLIKNYFITNHTCPYSGTIVTRVIKCILNTSFNPHAFVSFGWCVVHGSFLLYMCRNSGMMQVVSNMARNGKENNNMNSCNPRPIWLILANTVPFGKHTPAGGSVRQHETSPDTRLRALDDRLPCGAVAHLVVVASGDCDTLAILFPHQAKNLPPGRLDSQLRWLVAGHCPACGARV